MQSESSAYTTILAMVSSDIENVLIHNQDKPIDQLAHAFDIRTLLKDQSDDSASLNK